MGETADAFGRIRLNRISEEIANGTFEWRTIKRKLISKKGKKKSRPLGIVNFDDRVVQELIRIVLNTIYEPVFQEKEYHHGFRPKRGTRSAITKIERESQGMTTTIEGDIKSAYDNVNHKILMNFLKKKLVCWEYRKVVLLVLSFSTYICMNLIKWLKKNNKEEGRVPMEKASTKKYKKLKSRIDSNRARIKRLIKKHQGLNEDNIDKYKELVLEKRQAKKKRLQVPFINRRKILLTFSYTRYADDWIILTNASEKHCEKIKKLLTDILKTEFKLELSNEKTKITNLEKEHASFLGFTLKNTPSKVQTRIKKDGTKFKARTTLGPRIGIDHERVMKRLEEVQVIKDRNEKKLKPRHVGIYCSLKDWEIVTKFNQILRGLFNYYYYSLTGKSDLHKYYYLYRYSCLKTLAHRLRISIAKITKKYGNELIMKYFIYFKDQNGKKIKKERSVKFPTYKKLMNETGFRVEREKKEQFAKLEKMKEGVNKKFLLNKIEFLDVFKSSYLLEDPFMEKDIRVNLRTGLKIFGYCALCGVMDTKKNPIVMHHVKHIKKGQIQGFKEIMRSLNIKKLPVCDECHRKIHRGEYDQKSLKDFESINQN